ncbi:hypothetical protein [Lactiplantibacillus plantarum]|uniref:hypothetical protein n=1 Tax=Lactiplantibacillus plantarum TaxID=1590 RepID=UPI0028809A16|nr:hypothetical protein [Lactiplantibacillus plantarum]MCT0195577.1 hypothetical protein [Lactiplantibacillus plantarum]
MARDGTVTETNDLKLHALGEIIGMNEHEAYVTTFYWLADCWLETSYLGLEDEFDDDEIDDAVKSLLNRMQAGAIYEVTADDPAWKRAVRAVLTPNDHAEHEVDETDGEDELVLPAGVRPERQLEEVQAYAAMNAFLQAQDQEYLQEIGKRAATQVSGAGWQVWRAHRQSMHPESAAPLTLTAEQLPAVMWAFFDKYQDNEDSFEIFELVNQLEQWQKSADRDLDAQWSQLVAKSQIDPAAITLMQGLSLAIEFFDQLEWDGDLTAKATLQNKLMQRTLDDTLNDETTANWADAWQHWDLADPLTTEQWARRFDPADDYEEDEDESKEDGSARPAWQLGASYSTVLIAMRLVAYGVLRPESVPGMATVKMANRALAATVSIGIVLVAWLVTAILITIVIWGWRWLRKLIF